MVSTRQEIIDAHQKDLLATTIILAQQVRLQHPDDDFIICMCSDALYRLARYDEALSLIENALGQVEDPKAQRHFLNVMGHLQQQRGDFDQAELWHRKAISAQPNHAASYIYLGAILAERGKLSEAEEIHRRAASCETGCIDEAFLNLGYVLRGQGRLEEAADYFRQAIEMDPEYEDAIRALEDVETAIQLEKNL